MKARYRIMKHVYKSLNNHIDEIYKKRKINIFDISMFKLWNHCAKKLEKKNILNFNHSVQARLLDLCSMHNYPECHFKQLEAQLSDLNYKVAQVSELSSKAASAEPHLKQLEAQLSELKAKVAPCTQATPTPAPKPAPAPAPRRKYKLHIASQGYGWSGSSAVIGFFHEFSDITVTGNPDNSYTKEKVSGSNFESPFFWRTNFIPFINSFTCGSAAEKDWNIKRFIHSIYSCYDSKGSCWYEKNPTIYTDEFFDMALNFIYSVIDIDGYTIRFMKDKRFPFVWQSSDERFNKCCFIRQKGIKQFLFYKFKNITQEEFDHYVKQFVEGFLSLFNSNEIFVSDQMFAGSSLEVINKYLTDHPIKQICTYRDPRDRYLSYIRCYLGDPVHLKDFNNSYKLVLNQLKNPYEHRLLIRFEDLVLKYDETTQKIMDFCGIDPARHVRPKAVFNPAISAVNIGAYKYFPDQEFMRQMEEELGEICYYPEKENLSEEAWNLLKSVQ